MYSALPKARVLAAVEFFLWKAANTTRFRNIRVPNDRTKPCGFGVAYNKHEVTQISFEKIREVVAYDLRNAIFSLGDILILQNGGIPMGSNLSAAEAIMSCAHMENEFHESLGTDTRFLAVTRATDDCLGLTVFSKSRPDTKQKALSLIHRYQTECYDSNLILEREEIKNNTTRFLEAKLDFSDRQIRTQHFSRNYDHLRKFGKQRFKNGQHADSFTDKNMKLGAIIGRCVAISLTCQRKSDILVSMRKYFYDCRKRGYSIKILKKACRRMYHKTGLNVWRTLGNSREMRC